MELLLESVGGGSVFAGTGVAVGGKTVCVGTKVAVAGPGVAGKGLGATRVGRGVDPKPNRAVGVGCIPARVGRLGLGVMPGVLRLPAKDRLNANAHKQQNTSKPREGIRILPVCPCWLYFSFNTLINELSFSTSLYH
jgi:hypothetical protein